MFMFYTSHFYQPLFNNAITKVAIAITRFGIVCSSWVWISRSTTGRSVSNVLGAANCKNANCMVSRVVLLFIIAAALGIVCFLEQPTTSMMHLHFRFQALHLHPNRQHLYLLLFETCQNIARQRKLKMPSEANMSNILKGVNAACEKYRCA